MRWAILTGEYPPTPGGVSDYASLIAEGLAAAGDHVTVFAPPGRYSGHAPLLDVQSLPDHFGQRSFKYLDHALATPPQADRLLVQYVPHAFGRKAMNIPFASWVATRGRKAARVDVMFHEAVFPFSWRPMSHAILGLATRHMARLLLRGADRAFVSTTAWDDILSKISPTARSEWLPVPCVVPISLDTPASAVIRQRFASEGELVGHFGTYGEHIGKILEPTLRHLLAHRQTVNLVLLGRNSERFRDALLSDSSLDGRIWASGELQSAEVAGALRACDLMLQPFQDGITARRTSVMAALANRIAVVSNVGRLSEPLWTATDGLVLAPSADPAALSAATISTLDNVDLGGLGQRGQSLYTRSFSLDHTITRLRAVGHVRH